MDPLLLARLNRLGAAVTALFWYAARPLGLFALPGALDDAATWRGWLAMMPDWLWGLGLFVVGVWTAAAWYPVVNAALYPQWPDFEELDKRRDFRLWEVACFWVDQPARMPLKGAAKRQFKRLEAATKAQDLEVMRHDLLETVYDAHAELRGRKTPANPNWTVTRGALIQYARSINSKPRFLFPKERV